MLPIATLIVAVIATLGVSADNRVYDQRYLNATIVALIQSNGPVKSINAMPDRSTFWMQFDSGLQIQIPCDHGRHYYKRMKTCVDASKMVLIYDKCQVSKEPNCWTDMPFCFFDSGAGTYRKDNCLPSFTRNEKMCQCEYIKQ